MSDSATRPDDYHDVLTTPSKPVIVGGQAVNLWATVYLPEEHEAHNVSRDLDVLGDATSLNELSTLPDWKFTRTPLWAFGDIRHATMAKRAPDGRRLHVEILHSVKGLDKADLASPVLVHVGEAAYRVLSPVVMLKAKACNIMGIPQDGPVPRQDRRHFHLLAEIVPRYLEDIHERARIDAQVWQPVENALRLLFKTMQDRKIAGVFKKEGVTPEMLVPGSFHQSPSEIIRKTLAYQMPLARACISTAVFKQEPTHK